MQDLEMKKRVAQEIMDLMDQKEGENLKRHPKLMAASLEIEKKDPLEGLDSKLEDESVESGVDSEELTPEMIKKLIEMVNGQ